MIIGITGLAGSGKDTLAVKLKERLDKELDKESYDNIIYDLAKPIKDIVASVWGINPSILNDQSKKNKPVQLDNSLRLSDYIDSIYGCLLDSYTPNLKNYVYAINFKIAPLLKAYVEHHEYKRSPRQLMQYIGTELFKVRIKNDIWLDIASTVIPNKGDLIIPSIRFDDEAEWVRANGGVVIHIFRTDMNEVKQDWNHHISEQGISPEFINMSCHNDLNKGYDNINDMVDYVISMHPCIDNK